MPPKRKAAVDDLSTKIAEPRAPGSAPGSDVTPIPTPTLSAKRQRVSRACDQCRAAREKCDGVQPLCFSCVSQNRLCTYQASPKKRGVQTGYIRTLEIALGWVFEKVSGSEEALNAVLTHEGGQGQGLLTGKDPGGGGGERLHKRWRKSRVHKGIDRILSGSTGGNVPPSPRRDGGSPSPEPSEIDTGSPRMSSGLAIERPSESELDIALPSDEGLLVSDDASAPRQDAQHSPQRPSYPQAEPPSTAALGPSKSTLVGFKLRLPGNHWRLLDVYFSYTHSWLPILGKQDIFQASYLYPTPGLTLDPREPSSAAHAELWSALALASFQDSANSSNNTSSPRDKDGTALSPIAIYLVARSLIPLEDGPFQIHHSRALLLLSLANLGRGLLTPAWLLVGSAIRIALEINVNTQQSANNGRERQRIQSVLIACFIIDTAISVRDHKPPHLKADDLHQVFPVQEDGLDQWEPWTACEGFGTTCQEKPAARSPAYCLGTFNQLYRTFRLVSREMLGRSRNSVLEGQVGAASFISELHQAVDLSSPFGMFSSSTEMGSSPVPTAYLIRVIYLWGAALLAPQAGSWLDLIGDTLDHYGQQFGTCSIPPIIPSCLASLSAGVGGGDKKQVQELLSTYSVIWGKDQDPSLAVHHTSQPASGFLLQPGSKQSSAPTTMAPMLFTAFTPSSLYGSSALQTPQFHGGIGGSSSFHASTTRASYHQSAPVLTNTPTAIPDNSPTDSTPILVQQSYVQGGIPAMQISQQGQSMPPTHFTDTGSMYYDSILDDLASFDYSDPVEVDPRFMANLGFAPGSDFSEIFTRELHST